ncbi:MAG TPA: PEP-CTERM sorting domain-containing protein [Bryobacteraceae bacterium]|nr:PEP-CTERM sorting domain-containing protein [Bryobacteraceae bacterium]
MNRIGLLCPLLALCALAPYPGKAAPILEFTSGTPIPVSFFGGYANTYGLSIGWSFITNSAITVTALDAWNPDSGGDQVTIFTPGNCGEVPYPGCTPFQYVAQANVSPSDPTEGSPIPFYTQAIDPVTLAADTQYYIVQNLQPGTDASNTMMAQVSGLSSDPSIAYAGALSTPFQSNYPDYDSEAGVLSPAYFGPNFDIAQQTPEPASVLTLAGGLALAALLRRRKLHPSA